MSKLVTIYGGSGFVGRYITRRMAKAGWRVRVAVRRPNESMHVKPYGTVGQVEPVLCGKLHALGGLFYEPTIVTNATKDMMVSVDETFGPFAPLFKFEDEDDVIALANDTIFGLASYFYAKDLSRVTKVAEALEYGIVGVNTGIISTEVAPFGGVKQSGLGREGSRHGMDDYMEMKYICTSV